ncbi:hypothetical protein [Kangiella spongicola]|uniref:Uncharacterized protein n=1 Tax=Kangiella spongicola TaxID=796379 RepID=A0A318D2I1_9GAMM|nr:hypothetical protein [Kangiella spongicola]PXF63446.1 hypothetical protein DL796_08440 [Kangiella spongicola]
MNISLTVAVNFVLIWVLIATSLAYFLGKSRVKDLKATVILHFFLGFFPPLSMICLAILGSKKEITA